MAPATRQRPGAWTQLVESRAEMDATPVPRTCEWCGGENPRPRSRWCGKRCRSAQWNSENPGYAQLYARSNAESISRQRAIAYQRDADSRRERNRQWRQDNLEMVKAADRLKYERNASVVKARAKVWNRSHPEYSAAYRQIRRAREAQAPGNGLSPAQWRSILIWSANRCSYCGTAAASLTRDHVTALSSGGRHDVDNVVPACVSCNTSKHAKNVHEWAPTWAAPWWVVMPT